MQVRQSITMFEWFLMIDIYLVGTLPHLKPLMSPISSDSQITVNKSQKVDVKYMERTRVTRPPSWPADEQLNCSALLHHAIYRFCHQTRCKHTDTNE